MTLTIRPADPSDYDQIIAELDAWWGGRGMSLMLSAGTPSTPAYDGPGEDRVRFRKPIPQSRPIREPAPD